MEMKANFDFVGLTSDDGSHANESMHSIAVAYKMKLSEKLKEELADKQFNKDDESGDINKDVEFGRWTTTWWQQFSVLLRRGVRERRHDSFSAFKIVDLWKCFQCLFLLPYYGGARLFPTYRIR